MTQRTASTVNPLNTHYISDPGSLRSLCQRLRDSARIALDTEFVGEESFVPRLELIQVAAGDLCAVIDFPAVGSLDGLSELLHDTRIEKVVHAGRQDLELFYAYTGHVPTPIFDTQLAAAMVGYGTQVAYAQLVQRVLGTKLAKSHTLTNWSQRPLTPDQITYALEDVQYLLPVYEHLCQRLQSLGRLDWVKEEFTRLELKSSEGSLALESVAQELALSPTIVRKFQRRRSQTIAGNVPEWRRRTPHPHAAFLMSPPHHGSSAIAMSALAAAAGLARVSLRFENTLLNQYFSAS